MSFDLDPNEQANISGADLAVPVVDVNVELDATQMANKFGFSWSGICQHWEVEPHQLKALIAHVQSEDRPSPVAQPVNAGLVELPKEDTEEANKAITSMLAEYQYPANPQNAGRAGWRAARLYTARTQQAQKGGE